MAHEVHPKKIIETPKGKIVMEAPDMFRKSALSNSIYTYVLTDDDLLILNDMQNDEERNKYIQLKSLKKGFTTMQLTVLSFVTSAPFNLNDYSVEPVLDLKSFLEFIDEDTFSKMIEKMSEIGRIDPLSP